MGAGEWSFLSSHGNVMLCIAHDPGVRLRDIADTLAITERTAHAIVAELVQAGYVVKEKQGRRNRYRIEGHQPLRNPVGREGTVDELLAVLVDRLPKQAARGLAVTSAGASRPRATLPGKSPVSH
jgi:hypothetical protein